MSEAAVQSLDPKDSTKGKKQKKPRSNVKVMIRKADTGDYSIFNSQDEIDADAVREQYGEGEYELWRLAGTTKIEVVPEKVRVKFASAIHRKKSKSK